MYYPFVPGHAAGCAEGFAAFRTIEGPFVVVDSSMDFQDFRRVESFIAKIASVFSLVRMVRHVSPVMRHHIKLFPADFA